jgi:hypothetical protein
MTGLEIITLSLGVSHIVAGGLGWYVGHHGFKSAVNTLANLPTTAGEDIHVLKQDVADLKSVVFPVPTPSTAVPVPTPSHVVPVVHPVTAVPEPMATDTSAPTPHA